MSGLYVCVWVISSVSTPTRIRTWKNEFFYASDGNDSWGKYYTHIFPCYGQYSECNTSAHTHTHIASNVELWRLMKGFPFISSTQNHSSYDFGSPLVCTRAFVCMWFLCNGHGSIEIIWTMTNKSRKLITTMTVSHMRYVEFSDIIPKIRQAS